MFPPKQAGAMSAASPLPQVEIATTMAPGKRGPVGMSPRSDYSRVNTGIPPVPDAGSQAQKSLEPRGAEMLPKLAGSEVSMGQMAVRPTVNDMVKAAMAGAASRVDIAREATRQAERLGEETKTASAAPMVEEVPTFDEAEKLASALEYLADEVEKEASELVAPGKGPGALHVMESPGGSQLPQHFGQAHHTVPMHSGGQKGLPTERGATMIENDLNHRPGGTQTQQTALNGDKGHKHAAAIRAASVKVAEEEKSAVSASWLNKGISSGLQSATPARATSFANNLRGMANNPANASLPVGSQAHTGANFAGNEIARLHGPAVAAKLASEDPELEKRESKGMAEAKRGLSKAEAAHEEEKKEASPSRAAQLRQLQTKIAEDAINPAQISGGAAVKPDMRQSGESGGVAPSGGQTSMISSNESAINYTRGQAKSEPKADMRAYVTEPALSGSTDTVLSNAFAHSGQAGTKFASTAPLAKTAQARSLLVKLAADAEAKQKEKESAMGAS